MNDGSDIVKFEVKVQHFYSHILPINISHSKKQLVILIQTMSDANVIKLPFFECSYFIEMVEHTLVF